jgi:hypothetical protein
MRILALNLDLYACSTDFASAFVQAELADPVGMPSPGISLEEKSRHVFQAQESLNV